MEDETNKESTVEQAKPAPVQKEVVVDTPAAVLTDHFYPAHGQTFKAASKEEADTQLADYLKNNAKN
jgi:hypothetical protein